MVDYEAQLALIDRHIAEASKVIARQIQLIARLTRNGQSTAQADKLLDSLRDILEAYERHRRSILKQIKRITRDETRGSD
jgi:hypothetical protein